MVYSFSLSSGFLNVSVITYSRNVRSHKKISVMSDCLISARYDISLVDMSFPNSGLLCIVISL